MGGGYCDYSELVKCRENLSMECSPTCESSIRHLFPKGSGNITEEETERQCKPDVKEDWDKVVSSADDRTKSLRNSKQLPYNSHESKPSNLLT